MNLFFFVSFWAGLLFQVCLSYKPVFIIHGVFASQRSVSFLEKRIQQKHENTEVFATDQYDWLDSLEPLWPQVRRIGNELMKLSAKHPEGINLIGYSQGGLIARGILERFPDHNVKTFISLSSPQAGEFGATILEDLFPKLGLEDAYKTFYTSLGQLTSIGSYWNDPYRRDLYLQRSVFLPILNNEIPDKRMPSFKEGIVKLEKLVLIGGPDDEVITPWQSSQFGFLNNEGKMLEMRERDIYKEDLFGLKTLDEAGKIDIITLNGVRHLEWKKNLTVIDEYILPYLD